MTFVAFPTLARMLTRRALSSEWARTQQPWTQQHSGLLFVAGYCVGLAPPMVLLSQLLLIIASFFVPLMGRTGTTIPSDVVIAVLVALLLPVLVRGVATWPHCLLIVFTDGVCSSCLFRCCCRARCYR